MKERKWTNQYIQLIQSKPEYIVPLTKCLEDPADLTALQARIAQYSKVFCELGSGSGEHLIQKASSDPKSLFVAFELRFKRIFRTAEKAEELSLKNILLIQGDARKISNVFSEGNLSGIYINFPDPWAKKRRWAKHRLLNPNYFSELYKSLSLGGFFAYKTDHAECFQETLDFLESSNSFSVKQKTNDLYNSPYLSENVPSEFERLFVSKGYPIFHLLAQKV